MHKNWKEIGSTLKSKKRKSRAENPDSDFYLMKSLAKMNELRVAKPSSTAAGLLRFMDRFDNPDEVKLADFQARKE